MNGSPATKVIGFLVLVSSCVILSWARQPTAEARQPLTEKPGFRGNLAPSDSCVPSPPRGADHHAEIQQPARPVLGGELATLIGVEDSRDATGGGQRVVQRFQAKTGRLQKKHPRVARFFTLRHEPGGLVVTRDDAKFGQAGELCGNYVLRTDQALGAARIWSLYMTLLKAEEGYACLKGGLPRS